MGNRLAMIEQKDLIDIGHGEVEVVQDDENPRPAPRPLAGDLQGGMLMLEVQTGGRFVEEQIFRVLPYRLPRLVPGCAPDAPVGVLPQRE